MLLVLLKVKPQLYSRSMLVLSNANHWSFDFVRSQTKNSNLSAFPVVLTILVLTSIVLNIIYSPSKLSRGRWMFCSYKMWEESG